MKRWLVALALAGAVVGALAARVTLAGRAALADGDAAFMRGEVPEAIAGWEAAARWYLPLAPHVDDAYDRLAQLAARAEHDHDPARALAAWRAIRSAALATRGAWSPHAGERATADAAIARLEAADPEGSPKAGADVPTRLAWYASQLARDRRPGGGAAALSILGIVAWLAGLVALARRGITPAGRVARRPAAVAGGITLAGLACWAIGLAVL